VNDAVRIPRHTNSSQPWLALILVQQRVEMYLRRWSSVRLSGRLSTVRAVLEQSSPWRGFNTRMCRIISVGINNPHVLRSISRTGKRVMRDHPMKLSEVIWKPTDHCVTLGLDLQNKGYLVWINVFSSHRRLCQQTTLSSKLLMTWGQTCLARVYTWT